MPIEGPAAVIRRTGIAQSRNKRYGTVGTSQVYLPTKYGPLGYNVFGGRPTSPDFIRQLQRQMKALGLYRGSIDGRWGPQTQRAWTIYNQAPRKGLAGYGSTLGAQASYALIQKREQQKIIAEYQRLVNTLGRQARGGDITSLDRAMSMAQFWADQYGKAGGAFNKQAAAAKQQANQLTEIYNQYRTQLGTEKKAAFAAAHPSNLRKALNFVGADIVAPISRSPIGSAARFVGRDVFSPVGRSTAGRFLIHAVNFPHELINRAVYARQFLARQEGRNPGIDLNPFGDSKHNTEDFNTILGALGFKRFQSPTIQAALSATMTPEKRAALTKAGKLTSFGESVTGGKSGSLSAAIDFAYNFVDPTLVVGKAFKAITLVDDARKAEILIGKSPSAVDALTSAIAKRAEKMALKAPPGIDVGDVAGLQKLVPSLKSPRGITTELAAALVSNDGTSALAYLQKMEDVATKAVKEGRPTAKQFLADAQDAISRVKDFGMTEETRQAILEVSLGRTWKPRISAASLVVGAGRDRLSLPLTAGAMRVMPYVTRQAKLNTLQRLLRHGVKEATFIGKRVNEPTVGNLLRFTERTLAEKEAAATLYKTLVKKKFPVDVELKALAKRIDDLPDSPLRDILSSRFADVEGRVKEYLDAQLAALNPAQRKLLNRSGPAIREMVDAQKQVVKERLARLERVKAPGTDTAGLQRRLAVAQDKLRSLEEVYSISQGTLEQKALVKELRQLRKESVGLATLHPVSFSHAVENFNSELRDYKYMIGAPVAQRVSPWTRLVRSGSRTFDDIPKSMVNLHDVDERTKVLRDWAIALGNSATDADAVYARMAKTMRSEDALVEVKNIEDGLIRNFLVQEGLPSGADPLVRQGVIPDAVSEAMHHIKENGSEFLRENQGWFSVMDARARRFKSKYSKVYDVEGAKDPQQLAQLEYTHHLVSPADLRRYVVEWKRRNGNIGAVAAATADIVGTTLVDWYLPVHGFFKFAALTFAPVRYILRVALMEERLRMWMTHGFFSTTQVNAKWIRRLNNHSLEAGSGARFFSGLAEVGHEGIPMHLMDKHLIKVTGFGLIDKGGEGFTENLWHVLMYQVRPEDDFIHEILMPQLWKNDEAGLAAAKESVIETLETTEKGRVYLHKALMVDPKNADTQFLVDRTEKWLREVMPNDAVVTKRLGGQFALSELEKHSEWFPEKIWGDKYEKLWTGRRQPGEMLRNWKELYGRLVIQTPTVHLNRQPFAYAEFVKEFDSMTASGISAEAAREWAGEFAVHRTNEILFDASVRTRFAAKLDVVFPFQQAREEVFRVWSKLLREHPARAAKTLQLFATAFNNGIEGHVITKNQYDEWVLKVPGAPALSRALGRWAPDWVPFKNTLTSLAGTQYSFPLKSMLFVNDIWGITPRPGGPWWVATADVAVHVDPDLFPTNGFLQKYLFDSRNPSTLIFRPEVARLWIAATGQTTIPWEPFSWGHVGYQEGAGERIRDRMAGEVGAELYAQWIRDGADPKKKPTPQDVASGVRAALLMYGLVGMVVPASSTPTVAGRQDFEDMIQKYQGPDGQMSSTDWASMLSIRPDLFGFVFSHTKDPIRDAYTDANGNVNVQRLMRENPGYWEHWRQRGSDYATGPDALVDSIYAARDYLSPEEFVQAADRSRKLSQAWHDYGMILNSGVPAFEKVSDIAQLEKENSGLGEWQNTRMVKYRSELEFDMIMKQNPTARDELMKQWAYKYNVSVTQMQKLQADWRAGEKSHYDPWMEARNTIDVANEFQRNNTGLSATSWAEKNLTPAERFNFYNYMMGVALNVQDFNDMYAARGKLSHDHAKELFHKRLGETVDVATQWWGEQKHDAAMTIQQKFDQINAIFNQMQDIAPRAKAAHGKAKHDLWSQYYALKDKQQRLYAEVRGIQNSLYKHFPDLQSATDEVNFMRLVGKYGPAAIKQNHLDKYGIPYLHDNQQKKWDEMPERIKVDYVADLVERLTLPAYYQKTLRGEGHLYWDWLTDFQKDMLRQRLDSKQFDQMKRMSSDAAAAASGAFGKFRGGRFHRFRFRRFRWQIDGHTLGNGFGELAFALEMFHQYNRRGGMTAPKQQLAEYKRLGNNAVLKAQYLKTHPQLQAWFRAGPMANMPPAVADIVHNIMVKYGRWDDLDGHGVLSWDDVSELGFAHTILAQYNKRKGQAPKAYELWVKMPTGPARFKYMQQHPEIERWLQAGPMANMPNEFREVVRDIMTKFGEWTERTDPLSVLLEQYFATPDHAKQNFLETHPEIVAYWRAIRTGRDRQLFDLAQTYFSLPDQDSKRAYILAHPEVQDYFIQERTQRYESFLSDVARYLGRVPELAEHYLRDQTKFIREILDRFAFKPLVPAEVTNVKTVTRRD